MTKPWYASKTILTNLVALAASVATANGFDVAPEAQAHIVAGVMAVANIFLRLVTSRPLSL